MGLPQAQALVGIAEVLEQVDPARTRRGTQVLKSAEHGGRPAGNETAEQAAMPSS